MQPDGLAGGFWKLGEAKQTMTLPTHDALCFKDLEDRIVLLFIYFCWHGGSSPGICTC